MSTKKPEPRIQPLVTVDVVLLTLKEGQLQVALVRREKEPFEGQWALPGGWIHPDEDNDSLDAAERILQEKTGLASPYLEQLGSFASATRDPRQWSVSLSYYAVVPDTLISEETAGTLKWAAVDAVRALPFDHLQILRTAVDRVRSKTVYSSLPLHLMPKYFTLTKLQTVYEQLLGSALDKRGFRRWVEELGVIYAIEGKTSEDGHRPAQLYSAKVPRRNQLVLTQRNLGLKDGS